MPAADAAHASSTTSGSASALPRSCAELDGDVDTSRSECATDCLANAGAPEGNWTYPLLVDVHAARWGARDHGHKSLAYLGMVAFALLAAAIVIGLTHHESGHSFRVVDSLVSSSASGSSTQVDVSFDLQNLTTGEATARCLVSVQGFHAKSVIVGPIAPSATNTAYVTFTTPGSTSLALGHGTGSVSIGGSSIQCDKG